MINLGVCFSPFSFLCCDVKSLDIHNFVAAGKRNPIPDEMPPPLSALIRACWAQEPDNRFENSLRFFLLTDRFFRLSRPPFPDIVVQLEVMFAQCVIDSEMFDKEFNGIIGIITLFERK